MNDPAAPVAEANRASKPSETLAQLIELARRKSAMISPELLAQHVLAAYGSAEWPVQRAAMEALLRRVAFGQRDRLRVAERPDGAPFGLYRTRPPRSKARPYRTYLQALRPLQGSCDCPDFRRGSLGLCKHLLVVLNDLASRPRIFRQALDTQPSRRARATLAWNPIRPLFGVGDWMDRIVLVPGQNRYTAAEQRIARRFAKSVGEGMVLKNTFEADPRRRLEQVGAG